MSTTTTKDADEADRGGEAEGRRAGKKKMLILVVVLVLLSSAGPATGSS